MNIYYYFLTGMTGFAIGYCIAMVHAAYKLNKATKAYVAQCEWNFTEEDAEGIAKNLESTNVLLQNMTDVEVDKANGIQKRFE